MEASSNLSSSEARWTGNQPAASHSPSVLTCDQCLMKRLKRESTHDLHVQHNVADLILQVALRNSLTSKLPEQNNRMLHQSIFLRRAKSVLLWCGGCVRIRAIVLQDWVIPSSCEDRERHVADRAKLWEDWKTREESHRLLSALPTHGGRTVKSKPSLHLLNTQTWAQACARLYVFLRKIRRGQIHTVCFHSENNRREKFQNGGSLIQNCQTTSKPPGAELVNISETGYKATPRGGMMVIS